ncbi:MAG: choice-of-anchor D domain-containing protein, partial [Desulfobacteraceae bacterium]
VTGSVIGSGSLHKGALAGTNNGPIDNCFWDTQTSGATNAISIGTGSVTDCFGQTTAEMRRPATFAGWDIDAVGGTTKIWRIYEDQTYPLLRTFLSPLAVRANDHTLSYNGSTYSGGNGVTYMPVDYAVSGVSGTLTYTGSSQGAVNPGIYEIALSGLYSHQLGYDIAFVPGTLIIVGPEIRITGNGNEIANNDLTPGTADGTDFGTLYVSGVSVVKTFTIYNTGTGSLTLTGSPMVVLSGSTNFSVIDQPGSSSVSADGSTFFTIQFDPDAVGLSGATVTVANDDADKSPYVFAIQGAGTNSSGGGSSASGGGGGGGGGCFIGTTNRVEGLRSLVYGFWSWV